MKSQSGHVFLLLCFLLVIAAAGGAYYFARNTSSAPSELDPRAGFALVKERVSQAIEQPHTLNASVERNPNSFSCFYTTSAECSAGGGSFILYESAEPNALALSQLRRDNGLSPEGLGCRGFPSPLCPYRVEVEWSPNCADARCENTRTAMVRAKVLLDNGEVKEEWEAQASLTPTIKVSQAVACERDGGVWALTECITHDQASQRQVASSADPHDSAAIAGVEPVAAERAALENEPRVSCDSEIAIQGETYPLSYVTHNRATASVPAMNGCPAEDTFTFQCQPKSQDDREGQWIQIEARMAPGCDEQGNPLETANQAPR